MEHKLLSEHYYKEGYSSLAGYKSLGGYEILHKALDKTPEEVLCIVKDSGLRGRGGAGFPTGVKWGFLPNNSEPRYLLCNADEGEPCTFKDRLIMEKAPHQLIEGMLISAWGIKSHKSYIYIRGEYQNCIRIMEKAIQSAYNEGYLGKNVCGRDFQHDMDIYVGAGAYICGEETGMISSLEGKKGQPKLKPPFPAVKGYLDKPTIVNNVETLAAVVVILRDGVEAFRSVGTEKSPGTKFFSVSGCVQKPGNYEVPLGYPLMDLIELAGGLREGRKLKAVIPGGSSAPVLTAKECEEARMDFESLAELGSMLGSGSVTVMDDTCSMVDMLSVIEKFYHHESCGQCTPCREGTGWLSKVVDDILKGRGRIQDLNLIQGIAENMMGKTICALSDAAALPAISFVTKFRDEFEQHIRKTLVQKQEEGLSA
ncbi:MAG: NADH-quinone oxidoreductase subunit NuoF [Oligoflexia bacterium]|nr:NADH-quinone oxidoreductase subunit NuoF [Bdellovibrionales bacterium]MYE07559.1 NADH-quinone oxidoreductase subunit NuoF [Oligoflexia bacterium]